MCEAGDVPERSSTSTPEPDPLVEPKPCRPSRLGELAAERPLTLFFFLAYALSWLVMWPIVLFRLSLQFTIVGAFGPSAAAVITHRLATVPAWLSDRSAGFAPQQYTPVPPLSSLRIEPRDSRGQPRVAAYNWWCRILSPKRHGRAETGPWLGPVRTAASSPRWPEPLGLVRTCRRVAPTCRETPATESYHRLRFRLRRGRRPSVRGPTPGRVSGPRRRARSGRPAR